MGATIIETATSMNNQSGERDPDAPDQAGQPVAPRLVALIGVDALTDITHSFTTTAVMVAVVFCDSSLSAARGRQLMAPWSH